MDDDSANRLSDSLSQIFTGAIISFGGGILLRVSGLVEKMLVARFFTPRGYGQVVLGVTFLNLAILFSLVGLKTGLVRYLPRQNTNEKRSGTVYFVLQVGLVLGVVLSILLFIGADWISSTVLNEPDMERVLRVFAIAVLPAVIGKVGMSTAQGLKDARGKTLINQVLYPVSRVAFVAFAIIIGASVTNVSLAYVAGNIAMAAGALYYIHAKIGLAPRVTPDRRELLRFSLPLLFAGSMAFVSDSIDTLLLAYFLESNAVGIYNAAYPLANLVLLAPSLFGVILVPMISEYHDDGDRAGMRQIYKTTTRWTVCITLPGYLLMLLGPDVFIQTVFGNQYVSGTTAMVVVATGFFYHTALGMNGGALNMVGDSDFFLFSNSINAVLNLALNIFLIPVLGIVGAAVATAVSYSVANSIVSLRLYQKSTVQPIGTRLLVSLVIYIPIVFIMSRLVKMIVTGVLWVVVTYILSVVTFSYCYYLLGLYNEEEEEMVKRLWSEYV